MKTLIAIAIVVLAGGCSSLTGSTGSLVSGKYNVECPVSVITAAIAELKSNPQCKTVVPTSPATATVVSQ